ncbi:MAG: hypothetical protein OEU36_26095 [Gammaproteobacteria bacterium]|nr:hypothetical protein [Gammaproteobacteria bacterium]
MDHAIKSRLLKWQRFAADDLHVQLLVHAGVGIGGGDLADVRRIMWQIQSGPDADFQNLTIHAGESCSLRYFSQKDLSSRRS